MKVEWVKQIKTDTAAEALELSIKKWQFYSYCTKTQFEERYSHMDQSCGLCFWFGGIENESHRVCLVCLLGQGASCCDELLAACDVADEYLEEDATLTQFHAAARKVYEKLKSLRETGGATRFNSVSAALSWTM